MKRLTLEQLNELITYVHDVERAAGQITTVSCSSQVLQQMTQEIVAQRKALQQIVDMENAYVKTVKDARKYLQLGAAYARTGLGHS